MAGKRPHFRVGDTVYFNAFADPEQKNITYLCKGLLARLPTRESRICKVYVLSIGLQSTDNPLKAKRLLGMKIPKTLPSLLNKPAEFWLKRCNRWLEVDDKLKTKIDRKVKKKK